MIHQPNIRALHEREEPRLLVVEWQRFLAEQDHSAGTIKQYLHALKNFLDWFAEEERAELSLADLTPITLMGYRNNLQHEQQLSISTINMRISALRAWCAWLVEAGSIPVDPSRRVKLISGATGSKREGLKSKQADALLRKAEKFREKDKERNVAIVQILLQTGIRLSECSALTFGDIIFGERSGRLLVRAGKGNKVREVPLNASARAALASLVASRIGASSDKAHEVAAKWPKPGSPQAREALFLGQRGPLTTSGLGQIIAELVEAAGDLVPEETTAHTLRHTFARSYLSQYPGDLVGLATLLGHSSLDTTRLYSEPTVAQLARRVEQLKLNAYGEA